MSKQLTTVTTFSKWLALFMFVTFPFIGFYVGMNFQKALDKPFLNDIVELTAPNLPQKKACTMEAKQCPDGSYVGRTGPNCEFTKCPVR